MQIFLITIFTLASGACFWLFLRGRYRLSPLWIMLSVWFIAIAISQLRLSSLELVWTAHYWYLLAVSLVSFVLGFFAINNFFILKPKPQESLKQGSLTALKGIIYVLFFLSLGALYLFYKKAGNFPLLATDPDAFRFAADSQVPGLINY